MVERMPCMMIECAPEKRESIEASLESTAALSRSTSLMMVVESTTCSSCALPALGAHAARRELAVVVVEQHDAAVGGEQLEGAVEDLVEQRVDVELDADGARQLVADAQLLVVAPQAALRRDQRLGQEALVGQRRELGADVALDHARRDRHLGQIAAGVRGASLPWRARARWRPARGPWRPARRPVAQPRPAWPTRTSLR